MTFLVSTEWLKERMEQSPSNTVVIDVRYQLMDPDAGRLAYERGHIPGAIYFDLNKDLSAPVEQHGGNHPLPDPSAFVTKIGENGIDNDTTIIVYDQNNDMFAARAWWLFQYFGHTHVYVLEGGLDKWLAENNTLTTALPTITKKQFKPHINHEEALNIEQVKQRLTTKNTVLIDSRDYERYIGKVEPMYEKAGHIPGAKNFFWKDILTGNEKWKSESALKEHFSSLESYDEIIVSCGSGVSACPNILALKSIGFKNVKLYPGSFSDWISYEENKVAKGEE